MTTILVVVTFVAGASWGPSVTMTPTSSAEACGLLRWQVARQIANAARTNVHGGATVSKQDEDLLVVSGAQGTREVARITCKSG